MKKQEHLFGTKKTIFIKFCMMIGDGKWAFSRFDFILLEALYSLVALNEFSNFWSHSGLFIILIILLHVAHSVRI